MYKNILIIFAFIFFITCSILPIFAEQNDLINYDFDIEEAINYFNADIEEEEKKTEEVVIVYADPDTGEGGIPLYNIQESIIGVDYLELIYYQNYITIGILLIFLIKNRSYRKI